MAKQPAHEDVVDQVRLSLIYADDIRELGDKYKRKLQESRKDRSDYKSFCKEHSLFFAKDECVGDKRGGVVPRRQAYS